MNHSTNRSIAVFVDFENLALGFKDRHGRFEIKIVLKRLLEKGKIVVKRAYADWHRFNSYTTLLHEAAIELIEIPKKSQSGKNSADIRLCVDAMDLAYSKDHIDTFVIVSGDSDFSPLVSKLKELGKHVIGIGMSDSTSALLRDNCDEFIYYEDLVPKSDAVTSIPLPAHLSDARRDAFNHLFEALIALRRDDKEFLGAALVKNTICRLHPGFNEGQYGYKSFSTLLQDAAKEGLLELSLHQKAGTWVVAKFGDEMKVSTAASSGAAAGAAVVSLTAVSPVKVTDSNIEKSQAFDETSTAAEVPVMEDQAREPRAVSQVASEKGGVSARSPSRGRRTPKMPRAPKDESASDPSKSARSPRGSAKKAHPKS